MKNPEIRFKQNNGEEYPDWKLTSFGEACTGFEYGMNSASTQFDGENKYIRITDIDENSHRYLNDNIVSPLGKKDDKYIV
ncbi:MAG: hypothetical protein K2I80_12395 [Ruminococcus sp.]|nr:hypothetical protein [Ruminococcus sp.]